MKNQLHEELINKSFKNHQVIKCFWCDKNITEYSCTIDHLVSKAYARRHRYQYDQEENLRLVCYGCNHVRGKITSLYTTRKYRDKKESWLGKREILRPEIIKFEKLVYLKVLECLRSYLLDEIKSILQVK